MKRSILSSLLLFICLHAPAQINLLSFPEDMQLYSRDKTNKAIVEISGQVTDLKYTKVSLKFFEEQEAIHTYTASISQNSSSFKFEVPIEAKMREYRFELWLEGPSKTTLFRKAEHVICGDAFVLYGQSNAVSYGNYWVLNDSISKKFTRNYVYYYFENHVDDGWHDGTFPELGSFAKWFVKSVTEKRQVPVLLINASVGGSNLKQLAERNPANLTELQKPYGLMLKRVRESKVKSIRGFIFLQGESESYSSLNEVNEYPQLFDTFKKNLKQDFPPIDHYYIYQLGVMNNHALWEAAKLREFKRQTKRIYPDVSVIPATGISWYDFDGLHYTLEGYRKLASWLFDNLVAFEDNKPEFETPDLQKIINDTANKRLKLTFNHDITFKNKRDYYYYVAYLKNFFYAERAWGFIDSLSADGSNMYIYYHNLPANTLTYLPGFYSDPEGHPYGGPFIFDLRGLPVLTFYNVPIQNELPAPLITKAQNSGNSFTFSLNTAAVQNCSDCQLMVLNQTNQDEYTFNGNADNISLTLNQANQETIFSFRYTSPLSESKQVLINSKGEVLADSDDDGVPDSKDNCPLLSNSKQSDFDEDGLGDTCDTDADNDGILDEDDDCLLWVNPPKPSIQFIANDQIKSSVEAVQYHWFKDEKYVGTTDQNTFQLEEIGVYRVAIGDEKGCVSAVSDAINGLLLSSEPNTASLKIFPNPASKILNYMFENSGKYQIAIYAINGSKVWSLDEAPASGQIPLTTLAQGSYFIIGTSKIGDLFSVKKFIKVD